MSKFKYTLGIVAVVMAILVSGCNTEDVPVQPEGPSYTYATVKHFDNTTFGVTQPEAPTNGGYSIYDIESDLIVGFIQPDTMVNGLDGIDIGLCTGTEVTDTGLVGDCVLPEPEVVLPCPDTRDGTFPQSTVPSVCNEHGYFYCSLAGHCLNKPANVNVCGEIGSAQRASMNAQ